MKLSPLQKEVLNKMTDGDVLYGSYGTVSDHNHFWWKSHGQNPKATKATIDALLRRKLIKVKDDPERFWRVIFSKVDDAG